MELPPSTLQRMISDLSRADWKRYSSRLPINSSRLCRSDLALVSCPLRSNRCHGPLRPPAERRPAFPTNYDVFLATHGRPALENCQTCSPASPLLEHPDSA